MQGLIKSLLLGALPLLAGAVDFNGCSGFHDEPRVLGAELAVRL